MAESRYPGRSITLRSRQQDDGTWMCEYTIIEHAATPPPSVTGYVIGSFLARDEVETAALEAAQDEIDSCGFSSGLIH